jgi:hypothetical protein
VPVQQLVDAGWNPQRIGCGLEFSVGIEAGQKFIERFGGAACSSSAMHPSSLDSAAGTIMPSILPVRDRSFDLRHQLRRHLSHTMIVRGMGCDPLDQLLLGVGAGRKAAPRRCKSCTSAA